MSASTCVMILGLALGAAGPPPVSARMTGCQKAVFGEVRAYALALRNDSDRILVARRLVPVTNPAEEEISLRGAVCGRVEREGDGYRWRSAQRTTSLGFDAGLLLPGEEVLVRFDHRPLAKVEEFRVEGIFLPSTKGVFVGVGGEPRERRFRPFTAERWKAACFDEKGVPGMVDPPGPDLGRRAVLIPEEEGAEPFQAAVSLRFGVKEPDFTLAAARERTARLEGGPVALTRCEALGDGWVVLGKDAAWILRTAEQDERGELLPALPASLLKDVDEHSRTVSVRVGAGPPMEKGEKLWGKYATRPGDGMYTHGLFVDVPAARLAEFLRDVAKRGGRLRAWPYFFRKRHFALEL